MIATKSPRVNDNNNNNNNKTWVKKKNEPKFLIVHTTLKASESHYFDSGFSHHMTSNKSFFSTFTKFDDGNVTFCDDMWLL